MKTVMIFILSCIGLIACSQTRPPVKILANLAEIKYPGNIPVDDQGHPLKSGPDTSFTMIVESGKENIKWGKVYYSQHVYTVIPSRINAGYSVKEKESGRSLRLRPAKGNQLWRLELVPFDGIKKTPASLHNNEFMLQLIYGKKSLRLVKKNFTEIDTPPSV